MRKRNGFNIVPHAQLGFCSGCGVCVAVCPHDVLSMETNRVGEYVPTEVSGGCTQCGICLKSCPFVDGNPDEDSFGQALFSQVDGIRCNGDAGYYHESFVGYAPNAELRWAGASGGMLTWTLCDLLARDKIDHAITVHSHNESDRLYHFAVVSSPEEVMGCSKTSYYPVELSEVLRHVMEHPGRYAVVGLPCVCKAIRNAQDIYPKLKSNIRYVLGLVCAGQQVNKHFAHAVSRLVGVKGDLAGIRFRVKKQDVSPRNYLTSIETAEDAVYEVAFFDGVKDLWASGVFKLQGCNYCDDVFAECADVAFMDAWLPAYEQDPAGHNIVLSRRPELSGIYRNVETLSPIDMDQVVRSQAVRAKRGALQTRLFLDRLHRRSVPRKRVVPSVPSLKAGLKAMVQNNQIRTARKNLASGKAHDALRLESIPFAIIQSVGALLGRLGRARTK